MWDEARTEKAPWVRPRGFLLSCLVVPEDQRSSCFSCCETSDVPVRYWFMTTPTLARGSKWAPKVDDGYVVVIDTPTGEGDVPLALVLYIWDGEPEGESAHVRSRRSFLEVFKPYVEPIITEDRHLRIRAEGWIVDVDSKPALLLYEDDKADITLHPDGTWSGERL